VPSTVIRSFTYNAARRELDVVFRSGRHYTYEDVPEETFLDMKSAFAKGEFFNAHIRNRFRFIRRMPERE
jgi:lysyl-tRNA synthetase class 2